MTYGENQSQVLGELSGKPIDEAFLKGFQSEVAQELSEYAGRYAQMLAYNPGAAFQNGAKALGKNALAGSILSARSG